MDPARRFPTDIRAQHHQIDRDDWDDLYVVGDVHGCHRELNRLLVELDPAPDDLVVLVGDLVRKGPDSKAVIERVQSTSNLLSVRGNNEEKLLRGEASLASLSETDLAWLASLPVVISWSGALVAHAGIDPRLPLSAHTVDDLQTVRSLADGGGYEPPFWFDRHDGAPRVFFGHTVLERPVRRRHAVGLDTGCVYGGRLTALDVDRGETVSVEADQAYRERPDEKFLARSTASV